MNWALWAPIIGSVLTGLITLAGVIVTNDSKQKVQEAQQDARMEALESKIDRNHVETKEAIDRLERENAVRIGELKTEQQKHNRLMERTYEVEKRISLLESK